MRRLFFRCNGGHYFADSTACPFDGWSCEGLEQVQSIFRALRGGEEVTLARLIREGAPDAVVARASLIEFGDESSVFSALVPERYIYQGEEVSAADLPLALL